MYIRMMSEILLSEAGYFILVVVVIGILFYIIYLLLGNEIESDEEDDIDLWPK